MVVLDTNVYLSAFISPTNTPAQLIQLMRAGRLIACMTSHLWEELERVISYEKIRKNLSLRYGEAYINMLLLPLKRFVHFVPNEQPMKDWIPRDSADNWVIQCALTAQVDCIVSGDRHLISLGSEIEGIPILTPTQFMATWQQYPNS